MKGRHEDNFSEGVAASMAASGFGWHLVTRIHVLGLFTSGLFDRFPRLRIIIGHMGEILPFMLGRICQLSIRWGERERLFHEALDSNIWITTSEV